MRKKVKSLFTSRVFLVNLIAGIVKALAAAGVITIPEGLEEAILPLLLAENGLNVALRLNTTEPCSLTGGFHDTQPRA
jgi:hypothetical protein